MRPFIMWLSIAPAWASAFTSSHPRASANYSQCRCFPGDKCWPTTSEWAAFNETIGGRLVATVPIASVCHYDNFTGYNDEKCAELKAAWEYPETHYLSSSSPMASWFANNSCNPYTSPASQCVIGTHVRFAVNATGVADYQATLSFAAKRNIRLVIRNTGHDYFGKSTGAGALELWTHYLKQIEVLSNYSSAAYKGAALKLGAGVQAFEAYEAADATGLAVVGGDCDTVGIAGGYTQGGGLGPLSSTFGLGADQVLEWEVVTSTGRHITASPTEHDDLYWALSGGGGGTYAAVLSMTVRAYPTMKVASANLTFSSTGVSYDSFTQVVETFLTSLPSLAEVGTWSSFYIIDGVFELVPAFGPNIDVAELHELLAPTLAALNQTGIPYQYYINQFTTFYSAYKAMVPTNSITEANIGGRLIPRSLLETQDSVSSLMQAFQVILDSGGVISGIVSNQTNFPLGGIQNSVNPVFRTSVIDVVIGLTYNDTDYEANIALQDEITTSLVPGLEALTPGGGAYLNEADIHEPNWQEVFYGSNYERLESIKDKYDPEEVFYGLTAVGSDRWIYRMNSDGRLCRL